MPICTGDDSDISSSKNELMKLPLKSEGLSVACVNSRKQYLIQGWIL